jgi:hypothetical protein
LAGISARLARPGDCGRIVDEAAAEVEALRARCQALCDAPPGTCPQCTSVRVWSNGTRARSASLRFSRTAYVPELSQRRLYCRACRFRWTRRPPELAPRVHFQACVASHVVESLAAGDGTATSLAREHGCHRRTIGRLVARVAGVAEPAELAAEIARTVDEPVLPAPAEVPQIAERARTEQGHSRLRRAVWVLALVEVLATLRAGEPPALRWWLHERDLAAAQAMPADARGRPSARDPPSRA